MFANTVTSATVPDGSPTEVLGTPATGIASDNTGCLVAEAPVADTGSILWTERAIFDPRLYAEFQYTSQVLREPLKETIGLKNLRAIHTDTLLEIVCRVICEYSASTRAPRHGSFSTTVSSNPIDAITDHDQDIISTASGTASSDSATNSNAIAAGGAAVATTGAVLAGVFPGAQGDVSSGQRTVEQAGSTLLEMTRLDEQSQPQAQQEVAVRSGGGRPPEKDEAMRRMRKLRCLRQQLDRNVHMARFNEAAHFPAMNVGGSQSSGDESAGQLCVVEQIGMTGASASSSSSGKYLPATSGEPTGASRRAVSPSKQSPLRRKSGTQIAPEVDIESAGDMLHDPVASQKMVAHEDHAALALLDVASDADAARSAEMLEQAALPALEFQEYSSVDLADLVYDTLLREEFQQSISKTDLSALFDIYTNTYVLEDRDAKWLTIAEPYYVEDPNSSEAIAAYALPAHVRHSSNPNCFVGPLMYQFSNAATGCDERDSYISCAAPDGEQTGFFMTTKIALRALRPFAQDEPLTVDFVGFPECYAPVRAQEKVHLDHFGREQNPRWTTALELSRCFVCPQCGKGELCTRNIDPDEVWGFSLKCNDCGYEVAASDPYAKECRDAEKRFMGRGGATAADAHLPEAPMAQCHYMVFASCWFYFHEVLIEQAAVSKQEGTAVASVILECLARLYGPHPVMVRFCAFLQALNSENLETQRSFLQEEHALVAQFFPDEAEKLRCEVQNLLERNQVQQRHTEKEFVAGSAGGSSTEDVEKGGENPSSAATPSAAEAA